jgi:hypothetical protein
MIPIEESFNIVVNGAWNPSIFSAEWVLSNLAENNGEEAKVEIAYDVNDPTAPRKIMFEGLNLYPGRKRVVINPVVACLEDFVRCANVACKILAILEHTPTASLGINLSFTESETPSESSATLFQADDYISILGNYSVNESTLTRQLNKAGTDYILNYSFTQKADVQNIAFNFHYERPTIERMKEVLAPESLKSHYEDTVDFANEHYNLILEEPEAED